MRHRPTLGKLANIGLLLAGLALIVLLIEAPAMMGWVDYRPVAGGEEARHAAPRMAPHPPGKRLAGEIQGDLVDPLRLPPAEPYRFDFTADNRGFRNPRNYERADIVVLGDSFVENVRLGDSEILTALLAARLNATVVNFGRSGFSPFAELETLRESALELRPKVVVWVFFEGNDLDDIRAVIQPRVPTFAERSFIRNAWLAVDRAVEALRTDPLREDDRAASRRCVPRCPGSAKCATQYFGFRVLPLAPDDEHALASAFDVLREANRLADAAGAELVVAYAPAKFRVYRDLCTNALSPELAGWQLNELPERLRNWST